MKCKKCGETDPAQFYKNVKGKCKKCTSADSAQRYRDMTDDEKVLYRQRSRKWQSDNIFQFRWLAARSRAGKSGIEFTITMQDVADMWNSQHGLCYYSGLPMTTEVLPVAGPSTYSMSIDRKNSDCGYTPDNVVLCCSTVNVMKNNLPMNDFLQIVSQIYHHAVSL